MQKTHIQSSISQKIKKVIKNLQKGYKMLYLCTVIAQRAFALVARNTVICGPHSTKCGFFIL